MAFHCSRAADHRTSDTKGSLYNRDSLLTIYSLHDPVSLSKHAVSYERPRILHSSWKKMYTCVVCDSRTKRGSSLMVATFFLSAVYCSLCRRPQDSLRVAGRIIVTPSIIPKTQKKPHTSPADKDDDLKKTWVFNGLPRTLCTKHDMAKTSRA